MLILFLVEQVVVALVKFIIRVDGLLRLWLLLLWFALRLDLELVCIKWNLTLCGYFCLKCFHGTYWSRNFLTQLAYDLLKFRAPCVCMRQCHLSYIACHHLSLILFLLTHYFESHSWSNFLACLDYVIHLLDKSIIVFSRCGLLGPQLVQRKLFA